MSGARVFINYRREDSSGHAGRLYDQLSAHFGAEHVFMDIDTIEPGADFTERVDEALGLCDVLLAIIGRDWLTVTDESGRRRLDNSDDFVRLEIAIALARPDVLVIPVLVQGTTMPGKKELPEPLIKLSTRNALELSDGRWKYDVGRLIEAVEKARRKESSLREEPGDTPSTKDRRTRTEAGTAPAREGTTGVVSPQLPWIKSSRIRLMGLGGVLAAAVLFFTLTRSDDGGPSSSGAIPSKLDETRIAFLSDKSGSCEIHVVNADGTDERPLTRNEGSNLRPDWSPDGERLAFASNQDGDFDIYIVSVDTGAETSFTDLPGDEKGPSWSPDGTRIAFSSERTKGHSAILVAQVEGDQHPLRLTTDEFHNVSPDWSPDGTRIAFAASRPSGTSDIRVTDAEGGNAADLTDPPILDASASEFDPAWSPDGEKLAFQGRQGGDYDIWVVDADGDQAVNLSAHSADDRRPSWSPDGSMIVFGSDRLVPSEDDEPGCSVDARQQDLFMMNADGTDQRRFLRTEADDSSPAWSPTP